MFEHGDHVEFRVRDLSGAWMWKRGQVYAVLSKGQIVVMAGQPAQFYYCSPKNVRAYNGQD